MIFIIGLALIVAGWGAQVYKTWIKRKIELCPLFLTLYGVGCILLSIGNFLGDEVLTGVLNVICLILAAVVAIPVVKSWKHG